MTKTARKLNHNAMATRLEQIYRESSNRATSEMHGTSHLLWLESGDASKR